ncbi:Met18 protein [Starmerella bacillaris]|uniref:MMS19 nucleotide excision repair protein n=1 Tax=Starmerella bacillaris TaxID=1247836 RepID=A0AAV5RKK7_STABA|nr:Met18 protein [Starmerella bacillaris]
MALTPAQNGSPDLQALLNNYIIEDNAENRKKIAADIASSPLLTIVKLLGDPLTQGDELVRASATQCLADCIEQKPPSLIAADRKVLSVFFSSRLSDAASIPAACQGLSTAHHYVDSSSELPQPESLTHLLTALNDLDMLNMDAELRGHVYKLLLSIDPIAYSNEFVHTVVSLASGEKDPQNLMSLLNLCSTILDSSVDLTSQNLHDLYDITFCYYPVKFNPPKDAVLTVTADDIKKGLTNVLINERIAEYVVTGLLSKLAAINIGVKVDVYKMLTLVTQRLKQVSSKMYEDLTVRIWRGCKADILDMTAESETLLPAVGLLEALDRGIEAYSTNEAVMNEYRSMLSDPTLENPQFTNFLRALALSGNFVDVDILSLAYRICVDRKEAECLSYLLRLKHSPPDEKGCVNVFIDQKYFAGLKSFVLNQECTYSHQTAQIMYFLSKNEAYDIMREIIQESPAKDFLSDEIIRICFPLLLNELKSTLHGLAKICCTKTLVAYLAEYFIPLIDNPLPDVSVKDVLRCLLHSIKNLSESDLCDLHKIVTNPLLSKMGKYSYNEMKEEIEIASEILELLGRGVTDAEENDYRCAVLGSMGSTSFYLVLSALAPLKMWPFEDYVPKNDQEVGSKDWLYPKLIDGDEVTRVSYFRLLALSANKPGWGERVRELPIECQSELEMSLWYLKGELMRNSGFEKAVSHAQNALVDPTEAKLFGLLVNGDRFLVKENKCIIKPLFRQRLYSKVVPIFMEQINDRNEIALSSLIEFTPIAVIKSDISRISTPLEKLLQSNISRVQYVATNTILNSLPESFTHWNISPVISRVLELATEAKYYGTRYNCLQILKTLHSCMQEGTDEYKTNVINVCVKCLDDRFRKVRASAAACRQIYIK